MKVGDYIRTEDGKIGQIIEEEFIEPINDKHRWLYLTNADDEMWYDELTIIKSSQNIIYLIEERDILKIEEQKGIYTICEVERFKEPYTNYEFLGVRLENQPVARKLYELNIKSIVTHEQFDAMKYEVK